MPKRIIHWGNRNAFITSLAFSTVVTVVGISAYQQSNDRNDKRISDQAAAARKEIVENAQRTCEAAVGAVTAQSKADDLRMLEAIKQSFIDLGRPTPPFILAAENVVLQRQAPLASCEPKETPNAGSG